MTSVTIEDDEKEMIFLENRQGRNIKKSKDKSGIAGDGTGIGLFIVKKALNLMKAKISVRNNGFFKEENGYSYSQQDFVIEFSQE